MSESDTSDDAATDRAVTINGERADSIRYVRQGSGEARTVDVTFASGDTVIDTVRGIRGAENVRELVGSRNAERIDRGAGTGVLAGETLSAHETIRHRDGSATAGRWPYPEPSEWLQRDPGAAVSLDEPAAAAEPTPRSRLEFTPRGIFEVPYDGPRPGDVAMKDDQGRADYVTEGAAVGETGTATINGKTATSVLYERPDGAAGHALTWKEGRRIVARMHDAGDRELVEALGEANAQAVQGSEGKGRLVGKSLHAHEGTGTEAPIRKRSPRTAPAARGDQDRASEPEEANSVQPVGLTRASEPEPDVAPVKGGTAPAASEPEIPADDAERRRREQVLEDVRGQFRVDGGVYRFKDGDRGVAFTDRGGRLTTASNDARAARAVAAMADGKGWSSIKVGGHKEFRREAWLEASSRGLEARGYKATEQDLAELEERATKHQPNSAERTTPAPAEQGKAAAPDRTPAPERTSATPARSGAIAGKLVDHGEAPYKHDPAESPSYRVNVETERGARELWGVDLKRAVTESGAQPGDTIEAERVEAKAVTVEANRRDEQGRVVGTEMIEATRRGWDVRVTERRQVIDAVSAEFVRTHASSDQARARLGAAMQQSIDERARAGTLPAVPVYDHRAPSRAHTERAPSTQQGAERVPEHSR